MKLSDIKTGWTVLVSTRNKELPKIIQWFQKIVSKLGYKYNHAMVAWWAYGRLFFIEADKYGIAITPFEDYSDNLKYELLVLIPKFEVDGVEYGKFMLPFCGHAKYDKWNLLIAQPVSIISDGEIWLGGKENNKKFICAEWVYFVNKHFHPELFPKQPERICPANLFDNENFTHENLVF